MAALPTTSRRRFQPIEDTLNAEGTQISITVAAIFTELDLLEKRAAPRPAATEEPPM